jgi:leucyl aminopeptidase
VVGGRPGSRGPRLAAGAGPVDAALGGRLLSALRAAGASGRPDEVIKIPTLGLAPFPLVVVTGLGDAEPGDEQVRRGVGAALRALSATGHVRIAIDGHVGAIAEGALLGSYSFSAYKSAATKPALRKVSIAAPAVADNRAALKRARIVAEAVTTTRDLVNTPPNDLYPETFAARAVELAARADVSAEVLDRRGLNRGNYGGILAVGAGSARPPRLVRLDYIPPYPRARVALVGKGITFDSGGLNLKTANLTWMKSDMGGGAAVIASTLAAAALALPIRITATVPMAENMPSATAQRPGDVLTQYGGTTVEVLNTDAEGRLILADAIVRACEDNPDYLIETSTLTGAQTVALGSRTPGVMGSDEFRDRVAAISQRVGENGWPMPLPDELKDDLKSTVADLANVSGQRFAGMLVAGVFLREFVADGVNWAHIDVAAPAYNTAGPWGYTPKGGTGVPTRTMFAVLEDIAENG